MARGRRRSLVERWVQRAKQADDPFDRFFCSWIALVAAAQRKRTETGIPFREIYADREKVLEYFETNRNAIFQVLRKNRGILKALARRKGPRYGKSVLDTRSLRLRRIFSDFAACYTQHIHLSEDYLVEAFAEVLNKIRINLLQGVNDDHEDIELLELVNPLLLDILQACESL